MGRNEAGDKGPIPACAGQPAGSIPRPRSSRAYPRVCGATQHNKRCRPGKRGLSPRVRGNPCGAACCSKWHGPIPACAGQPAAIAGCRRMSRAYPRVCGATSAAMRSIRSALGLSPRVRGNPLVRNFSQSTWGPIPACAGQPARESHGWEFWGAYPRVCGATSLHVGGQYGGLGLSPRVRGNHLAGLVHPRHGGPIPACAGQPLCLLGAQDWQWAYPRVCGATYIFGEYRNLV